MGLYVKPTQSKQQSIFTTILHYITKIINLFLSLLMNLIWLLTRPVVKYGLMLLIIVLWMTLFIGVGVFFYKFHDSYSMEKATSFILVGFAPVIVFVLYGIAKIITSRLKKSQSQKVTKYQVLQQSF